MDEGPNIVSFMLRLGVGIPLLYLGLLKTFSPVALAVWMEWLTAVPFLQSLALIWLNILLYTELLCGLALIAGLFTRYAAGIASVLFFVQLFFLNWYAPQSLLGPWGPFMMKDFVLLAGSLSIVVLGAPSWSLDELFE